MPTLLMSAGIILAALFGLGGAQSLWLAGRISAVGGMAGGAVLFCLGLVLARFKPNFNPRLALGGLILFFVSDWMDRTYSFYQGPSIRGEILVLAAAALLLLPKLTSKVFHAILAVSALILCLCFFFESQGRIIFSDDHSTFLFRLVLLTKNFPRIPFYYPGWNAGIDARDFFATGSLNVFVLFSPLLYLLGPLQSYNLIVVSILCLLLPLSVYTAARLEGLDARRACVACILALSNGLVWYKWGLKYGPLGFLVTACLTPLGIALAVKLLRLERWSTREACLAFAVFTLMFLWAPAGAVFVPLAAAAVFQAQSLGRRKEVLLSIAGVSVFIVPFLLTLWSVSNVQSFLTAGKTGEQIAAHSTVAFRHRAGFDLSRSLTVLRETAQSTNPLLLVLGLPGLLLMAGPRRRLRLFVCLWLLALGTIAVPLKPQLELDRMLVLLSLYLCIPASALVLDLIERAAASESRFLRCSVSLMLGFLFCGIFSAAAVFLNRTVEQYRFTSPLVPQMILAIREFGGEGRVLFSGFVLHELSEGHLAPLSEMSGRPLIASSPFHNRWRYEQVFPKSFLERGDVGIEEYLKLLNVSAVLAHEREQRAYFSSRPGLYQEVWRFDRWSLFRLLKPSNSYLLEGSGEVVGQDSNSFTVRADSTDLTVSFTYFPFLEASGCRVEPARLTPTLHLVRLSGCTPGQKVLVQSKPLWRRLLANG